MSPEKSLPHSRAAPPDPVHECLFLPPECARRLRRNSAESDAPACSCPNQSGPRAHTSFLVSLRTKFRAVPLCLCGIRSSPSQSESLLRLQAAAYFHFESAPDRG